MKTKSELNLEDYLLLFLTSRISYVGGETSGLYEEFIKQTRS